jgi:hypothetical protein
LEKKGLRNRLSRRCNQRTERTIEFSSIDPVSATPGVFGSGASRPEGSLSIFRSFKTTGVRPPKTITVKVTTSTPVPNKSLRTDTGKASYSRSVTQRANATAPRRPENQIRTWCLKGIRLAGLIRE